MHYLLLLTLAVTPSFGMGKWTGQNKNEESPLYKGKFTENAGKLKNKDENRKLLLNLNAIMEKYIKPKEIKKNNAVFTKKVTPEQVKRSLKDAIRREKAEKEERGKLGKLEKFLKENHKKEFLDLLKAKKEEKNKIKKSGEHFNKKLLQKAFSELKATKEKWYKDYLGFIDDQRNQGLVTVQGTGKYYRRENGFYAQNGHKTEEARYLFGKKTPAGAIMAAVESGVIQPSDVLVLFDVDRTLIMSAEGKARGIKYPEKHNNKSIHTTKDMKEILEHMKMKQIPYGYITLRGDENLHKKGMLAEETGFNDNLLKASFNLEYLGCEAFNQIGLELNQENQALNDGLLKNAHLAGIEGNIIATGQRPKSTAFYHLMNAFKGQENPSKYMIFMDDSPAVLHEIKNSLEGKEQFWVEKELPELYKNGPAVVLINYAKGKEADDEAISKPHDKTALFDRETKNAVIVQPGENNPLRTENTLNLLQEQEKKFKEFLRKA